MNHVVFHSNLTLLCISGSLSLDAALALVIHVWFIRYQRSLSETEPTIHVTVRIRKPHENHKGIMEWGLPIMISAYLGSDSPFLVYGFLHVCHVLVHPHLHFGRFEFRYFIPGNPPQASIRFSPILSCRPSEWSPSFLRGLPTSSTT